MPTNLHIAMNSFAFGSRILKETKSLIASGVVDHVHIAAIHEEGLKEYEQLDPHRSVWRFPIRSKTWPRHLPAQGIKYLEFCFRVVRFARKKDIGIVNVHNLALLPLGVCLKVLCRAKLVYDAHELETETFGLTGARQTIARLVERLLIKYADLTIVVGDGINEWYRKRYGLSNVVTVLNCPEYQEPQRTRRLHQDLGIPEAKKIVIYQGGLVEGRGIERLLEVFAASDDGMHVLVLMGYGELEPLIRKYAQSHDNIFLKEAVEPGVVLQYTASADVGIAYIDNPSLNDSLCLPNKLFEYLMAQLPVVVNNAPEMARVVRDGGVGTVLHDLSAESLRAALAELARTDEGILKSNVKRASAQFSWRHQEQVMVDGYKTFL